MIDLENQEREIINLMFSQGISWLTDRSGKPGTGDYQFNVQPGYILANRRAYQA